MNLCVYFAFLILIFSTTALKWNEKRTKHQLNKLQPSQVTTIINQFNLKDFETILDPMLIPRVAGSPSCKKVRTYITEFFEDLSWSVEEDSFTDKTPYGNKEFVNVIATLNPKATRRLVLACHYDSKLNREQTFVMATDSAVPCAMLMSMAKDMQTYLTNPRTSAKDVTLQFIFFDGEEAFVDWTSTDSLYGSRHLAQQLGKTPYPKGKNNEDNTNELHRMDAFVLLDLLGAPNPKFHNFFEETSDLYKRLASIEKTMHQKKQLINHVRANQYFTLGPSFGGIEDDHIPFYRRGVPILHLIPSPFPVVWHRETDDKNHLDFDVIENLNKIFRVFVAEYLHLVVDEAS